jgi:hypothetical protein
MVCEEVAGADGSLPTQANSGLEWSTHHLSYNTHS